jgi:hypothetical protein
MNAEVDAMMGTIQCPFMADVVNSTQDKQPDTIMKKFAITALTAVFAGSLLTASIAEARPGWRGGYGGYRVGYYGGGYRRGPGIGGALAAGAAIGIIGGAIAASQGPRYAYPYGYAPAYGYAPYGYAPYGYAPAPAYGYAPVYGY